MYRIYHTLQAIFRLFLTPVKNHIKYGLLIAVAMYFYSCDNSIEQKVKEEKFGLDFIELCIDSTLHIDPGTSGHIFYVDFSKVNSIDSKAINTYLVLHKSIKTANLDSLFKNDSMWTKYGYFNIP